MDKQKNASVAVGRFAPSPSGRMHFGNVFSALLSWLSVRSRGGRWVLRIEDLDPMRSKTEYSRLIEDDLAWLGLDWDEGGLDDRGSNGPYSQSRRSGLYEHALAAIKATGYAYPCYCTRADIMATQAPHQSDGRIVYGGTCRPDKLPCAFTQTSRPHAIRLAVPDRSFRFDDLVYGPQECNLVHECGDFILRRSDGAWAYQLAVVVDDAAMGITEVVRGSDLLLSTTQQLYLYELLGLPAPTFAHVPLICNADGRRLSKRDRSLNMEAMRSRMTAPELIGRLAATAGLVEGGTQCTPTELLDVFDWRLIPRTLTLQQNPG